MTTKTYDSVDQLPDLNEEPSFKSVDDLPDLKKKEISPFDYKRQASRSGGLNANLRRKDSESSTLSPTIKTGFGKLTIDNDIDRQFDLSLSNPDLFKPKNETDLTNLYYKEAKQRFDIEKEGTKAEIKSSPESLAQYTQKRIGEINADIEGAKDNLKGIFEAQGYGAKIAPEERNNLFSKIEEANLYKEKLKNSVVQEAAKQLIPKFMVEGYDPRQLGREIVRVADPELNAKYEESEKNGFIPQIQNAQLERLGLELSKNFLENQEQTPEVQQKLSQIKQSEAEFDTNNFELTAQMVKDKLGVYFYKKGKSGFWGYSDKNIEEAINDPALKLSETEKKVALEYVLPTEKKLFFSTEIPGSGFFRSAKGAIEKSVLNSAKTLQGFMGQRTDADRAFDLLNAPVEESRFTPVGEGATLKQAYSTLVAKQNDGSITEEEKIKKDQIGSLLNVRNNWAKFSDGVGDLTGQVLEIALLTKGIGASGRALKLIGEGGGLVTGGMTSSAVGNVLANQRIGLFLSSYLNANDSYRMQALELMPGDENADKREAYANTMSWVEGASEGIFNDVKVLGAFTKSISPTVRDITTRLLNKEITQRVAKEEMVGAMVRYLRPFGKEFLKAEVQESSEEAIVDIAQGVADSVFGGQPFDLIGTGKKAVKTFLTTALHSPLVSAAAAHGGARKRRSENAFFKSSLVDMGLNQTEYLASVEDLQLNGEITEAEAEEKKQIITKAAQYLQELPEGIDSPSAATYITHRLNEDILQEQIGKITDPVVSEPLQKQVQRSVAIRKGIFDGTIGVTPDTQEVTDDPKLAKELDILDASKVNSEELIGTPFEKPIKQDPIPMTDQTEGAAENVVPSTLKDEVVEVKLADFEKEEMLTALDIREDTVSEDAASANGIEANEGALGRLREKITNGDNNFDKGELEWLKSEAEDLQSKTEAAIDADGNPEAKKQLPKIKKFITRIEAAIKQTKPIEPVSETKETTTQVPDQTEAESTTEGAAENVVPSTFDQNRAEDKKPSLETITEAFGIEEKDSSNPFWKPTEKSAKDVMDWLENSEYSLPHEKELLKKYKEVVDPNLKIVFDTTMPMNRGGGAVYYKGKLESIQINPKATTLKGSTSNFGNTIMHEITHALTYGSDGKMNKGLVDNLAPLYDVAYEYINKNLKQLTEKYKNEHKITYGLSGVNEFAAEAMSNRSFQEILSSIPYKGTTKSVWSKFIDGIKDYFSKILGTKNETLLNEVVGHITNYIDPNVKSEKQQTKPIEPVSEGYVSKYPKPSKPISQMSSEELTNHSMEVRKYLKDIEVDMFGVEGAKKYREAQRVLNNMTVSTSSDTYKEASALVDKMEASLSPAQQKEFFGLGEPGEFYEPSELRDIATKVRLVEESENVQELGGALKLPLLDFNNNPNSEATLAVLNAAKNKAEELGIDPKEMLVAGLKRIAKDIPDRTDLEDLASSIIEKLSKPVEQSKLQPPVSETKETTTQLPVQTETTGAEPPSPPEIIEPTEEGTGDEGGKKKSLANRLVNAKNVPDAAKAGIKAQGLTYEPQSQQEAQDLADAILGEVGIDDAVLRARAQEFGGDVNTLVQTQALNRLAEMSDKETDPDKKLEIDQKFAEVGIQLDEWLRKQGRGIAALNFFYKKSPLGMQMVENARRKQDFEQWSKPKDKSWKEFFDEMMKDPEFEDLVKAEVKKERADERKERKEKVHKDIDDAAARWAKKVKPKTGPGEGAQKQGIGTDEIFKAAATAIKAAYDAGEAVVKIVQDAIDYISEKLGHSEWDTEGFRKEWETKLKDKTQKKKLTDEEIKARILDRFRTKLKGLTDKQKEEVVRKSFQKIVESGGLDYDDFKKIIADITGRGEMTQEEADKLKELVKTLNSVEDAATEAREKRTPESLKKFKEQQLLAGKASKDLNKLLYNQPNVIKRLTSMMQLLTLGIPALVNNPIYNVWNQTSLRFPIGVVNTLIDGTISAVAKAMGKNYTSETNIIYSQKEFFKKLGLGLKESTTQFVTGLDRQDYTQKELHGQQIRPLSSAKDLWQWIRGKKSLTKSQAIDKALQASPQGWIAEGIARTLNLGDKPQRFAAEGSQAAAFAKALGIKDIDYNLFIEFPREEAYRQYKAKGLSDVEAGKKADYVRDTIVKEGQRSTFQQDNMLNDVLNKVFGGEQSGVGSLAKALAVSPFIKIPANAYWSYFNLVNPEVALLQSAIYGGKAISKRNKGDNSAAKDLHEARYWFAHAAVGIGVRAVVTSLVLAGVFRSSNDEDDTKKEREGEANYEPQGTVNVTKLFALLRGDDPSKVKGGLVMGTRWWGHWGSVGNTVAKRYEDMTPEQKKASDDYWNMIAGNLELSALQELEQGVFGNTSFLLTALQNPEYGMKRYGLSTINMFTNIIHPAAFAQLSRAEIPYVSTAKADTFGEELKNSMLQRSSWLRKLSGQYPPAKIGIWGDKIERTDNEAMRLFGFSNVNKDAFARPIYDDAKRTSDIGYFPPAIKPEINGQKLNVEQSRKLEEYIGQARKSYIAPYVNDHAVIDGFDVKYSKLSDEDKKWALQYLYGLAKDDGEARFLQDFPAFTPPEKDIDYQKEVEKDLFKLSQKYK